jgi:hypothetical protein
MEIALGVGVAMLNAVKGTEGTEGMAKRNVQVKTSAAALGEGGTTPVKSSIRRNRRVRNRKARSRNSSMSERAEIIWRFFFCYSSDEAIAALPLAGTSR